MYVRKPRMAVHKIKSIRFNVQFYYSDISIGYLHETEGELMILFCPGPCIRVTAYTRQDLGILFTGFFGYCCYKYSLSRRLLSMVIAGCIPSKNAQINQFLACHTYLPYT